MNKSYYRVMLGAKSRYAAACRQDNFIGTDFSIRQDLTKDLFEDWREFNQKYRPIMQKVHPDKNNISAGSACGALWTVSKGIKEGDVVLSPTGEGSYMVGEVVGKYEYKPDGILFHRRPMKWYPEVVERTSMSDTLRNSISGPGTVREMTQYADELERLISGITPSVIVATDPTIEDPSTFALEKHLEDFLVQNWSQTELGKKYEIFQDGENSGQQYPTDTGPIDILAVSKDKKELLVVELKKGRASDSVVGQVQRYMGFIMEEIAEKNQSVKGVIIALDDDLRIKRALKVASNIEFYTYEVSFKLRKAN